MRDDIYLPLRKKGHGMFGIYFFFPIQALVIVFILIIYVVKEL